MIVNARIDGRLIHGQVANLWSAQLNIDRFIVIDDDVANSDIEKTGQRLAAPATIRLSVLPVARAAKQINDGRYGDQRLMLVAKTPHQYLELVNAGVELESINVGNMSQTPETTSITNSVNVVQKDVDAFKELDEKGVKLYSQMVPSNNKEDFMSLLAKKF